MHDLDRRMFEAAGSEASWRPSAGGTGVPRGAGGAGAGRGRPAVSRPGDVRDPWAGRVRRPIGPGDRPGLGAAGGAVRRRAGAVPRRPAAPARRAAGAIRRFGCRSGAGWCARGRPARPCPSSTGRAVQRRPRWPRVLGGPDAKSAAEQGLGLEGLSREDREFEVARAFVRFADTAARLATQAPAAAPAADAADGGRQRRQQHLPGLVAVASGAAPRRPGTAVGGSGRATNGRERRMTRPAAAVAAPRHDGERRDEYVRDPGMGVP